MRDILIFSLVLGSIPFILRNAWYGVLVWSWLGYMNPHRLGWGFAYDFPFAQLVAIVTLVALLYSRERSRIPVTGLTIVWALFIIWISITTLFATDTTVAIEGWEKAMKIQLFSVITILLMQEKKKIIALVWTIGLSLGFFGLKGGAFAIRQGGEYRVWGPPGTFIQDNNALALALIMTIPLLLFLFRQSSNRWARAAMMLLMILSGLSVFASFSRGAFLAIVAVAFLLWLRSNRKLLSGIALVGVAAVLLTFMPNSWHERIETLQTYQEDNSAMGRLTAWQFAAEMASQRLMAGGFNGFTEENYRRYSPEISAAVDERDGRFQGAHSIYFRVLGEHGFIGLGLFLSLGYLSYRRAGKLYRQFKKGEEEVWVSDLAGLLQVSLAGYAVGGAFLGLSYFDLFYHLVALVVLLQIVAARFEKTDTIVGYGGHDPVHSFPGNNVRQSE